MIDALVLRPLNVPHSENLFMLERAFGADSSPSQAYPDYVDLRERNRSFESLVSYYIMGPAGLDTGGGDTSVVWPYLCVLAQSFQQRPCSGRPHRSDQQASIHHCGGGAARFPGHRALLRA